MGKIDIIYFVIGLLLVLNIIIIFIAVKCAHRVDDDFEFIDDDDNHIDYYCKLIAHNRKQEEQ